jgi:hypothetical protein
MVKMSLPSRWAFALILFSVATSQAGVFSEQPKDLVEARTYGGVFGSFCGINRSGNFSGSVSLTPALSTDPQEINLIPRIDRAVGGGVFVGSRKDLYALEVSYWRSQHIAEFDTAGATFQSKANYQAVNIDLKRYFLPRLAAQPFLAGGLSFPWLDVKEASLYPSSSPTTTGNATYSGLGFNLTVGMEVYFKSNFSFFGAIQQRWAGYGTVKGYTRTGSDVKHPDNVKFNLRGEGVNIIAGLTTRFF